MALIISILLAFSLFLRSFSLSAVPPELFGDEIDVGYQALSLLTTGHDYMGQALPFYLHSLAEWRAPLLIYATVPTIAIFGNTIWGVRLPEVIFGSLAPVILYLLVYQTTHNKKISLLSSLTLSLLPWHIHYSRAAFEVVILLDLLLLGTLLYLKRAYVLSFVFFVLTIYTYSTAVVFTPLWVLFLFLYTKKLPTLVAIITSFILVVPFASNLFLGRAQERFSTVSILNNAKTIDQITAFRKIEPSPWFHNKIESYVGIFVTNYFRAFSSDFLFIRGDPTMRHSLQYIGQLLPLTAPFLLLGLHYFINRRHYLWLTWLLLSPIPAALTVDGSFHATRLFIMVPPLVVAVGAGLSYLRKSVLFFLSLVISIQLVFVGHYYLVHYPKDSWRWWHTGYQELFTKLPRDYQRYFINSTYEPALIRFLFYTSYSPDRFQKYFSGDQFHKNIAPGYNGFSLGENYYFGTFAKETNRPFWETILSDSIYIVSSRDDIPGDWDWRTSPPQGIKVLYTVTNPSDQPIFYVITKN